MFNKNYGNNQMVYHNTIFIIYRDIELLSIITEHSDGCYCH